VALTAERSSRAERDLEAVLAELREQEAQAHLAVATLAVRAAPRCSRALGTDRRPPSRAAAVGPSCAPPAQFA
jgi:hypothetical protein